MAEINAVQNGSGEAIRLNVLIVDDHSIVRTGLSSILCNSHPDASVSEASSFRAAQELLQKSRFDLILVDLILPDANPAPIERLAQLAEDARIVIVSMITEPSLVRRALNEGAVGYIPKSSSPLITERALDLVIAGGTYLPPEALDEFKDAEPGFCSPVAGAAPQTDQMDLTRMQYRVLRELVNGESNKQIARTLGLALPTVKAHVSAVLRKLGAPNRTQAAIIARRRNIL